MSRIVHCQRAGQSRREKTTNPTETAGPVPSRAKVRSRVIDVPKGPQHPENLCASRCRRLQSLPERYDPEFRGNRPAGADGLPTPDHRRQPSEDFESDLSKRMKLQNDYRVDTLIVMIGTNDVSRNPVTPEVKWESLLICLLTELKEV